MPRDPKKEDELETFRTEYQRLIGGAIISGLITPRVVGSIMDFGFGGGGVPGNYTQQGDGNYTQFTGNHEQTGNGNYTQ